MRMTTTPWGDSEELLERRLRPGPGTPREEVERNQRERLFGATVAVTTTKGYANTSVADLLEVSCVSRSSFYGHFEDKLACFLATMEEILTIVTAVTASRVRRAQSWEEGAERGLRGLLELIAAQPAGARLCLVEADAAGPQASGLLEGALERFQKLMEETFDRRPGDSGMPEEMVQAMVGGLRKMLHTRLRRGTEHELVDLAGDLLGLDFSYVSPPMPLRERGTARAIMAADGPDPGARSRDTGERIVRATLATVAAKGFPDTSIADIVAAGGVSRSTFYEFFEDKEQALASALYSSRLAMEAAVLPAYRRGRNWPEAIRDAVRSLCTFLASRPDFAEVTAIQIYTAGPAAQEGRDRAIDSLQVFIEDGFEDLGRPRSPIVAEATVNAVYSMFSQRVRVDGPASLPQMAPLATYMILSPLVGPERACAVVRGETLDEALTEEA
jgi:AcrR family transcriptional regulator